MSALRWNAAGAGIRAVCQLGITSLLARELGPRPFGIVAAAIIVISAANLFATGGIGAAIVQAAVVNDLVLRSAFTLQMAAGIACAATITLLAEPAGRVFREPALPGVLVVMSSYFVVKAFGETSDSMLRRRLDFRLLQCTSIGSYLIGYGGIGLTLALVGAGVWSLVMAYLGQAAIYSALTYWIIRHPTRPLFRTTSALLRFGASAMSVNAANSFLANADNFVVGRFFGTVGLGLYSRAFNLIYAPIQGVVVTVQQVLFPIYARASTDGASVRDTYLSSVNGVALCMVPTFLSASLVSETVMLGLYGAKWAGAAALLVPLSLSMPFYAVMSMAGPVLWGRGEAFREFRIQAIVALSFGGGLAIALRHSPSAVAWTVLGVSAARAVLMTLVVAKTLEISRGDFTRCLKGPLVVGIVTSVTVRALEEALSAWSVGAEARLVVLAAAGTGCVAVALRHVGNRLLIDESLSHLARFRWFRGTGNPQAAAADGSRREDARSPGGTAPWPTVRSGARRT